MSDEATELWVVLANGSEHQVALDEGEHAVVVGLEIVEREPGEGYDWIEDVAGKQIRVEAVDAMWLLRDSKLVTFADEIDRLREAGELVEG